MKKNFIITLIALFVVLSITFYGLSISFPDYRFATLETGNVIMAVLTFVSYLLVNRKLNQRPQAFVTGVYSASLLKLMACMVAILVYVMIYRSHIHKPSVFVLFGIYGVYTFWETIILSKMARK